MINIIREFIKDVCQILEIQEPIVSFNTTNFASDTMLAQCSPDGSTIFLKKGNKLNPDCAFAIAHELRHIWQVKNDEGHYFDSYKPVNLMKSVDEYNLQVAEVDANAFAAIVMIDFFNIKPLWNGLSKDVVFAIEKRKNEIIRELNIRMKKETTSK